MRFFRWLVGWTRGRTKGTTQPTAPEPDQEDSIAVQCPYCRGTGYWIDHGPGPDPHAQA